MSCSRIIEEQFVLELVTLASTFFIILAYWPGKIIVLLCTSFNAGFAGYVDEAKK